MSISQPGSVGDLGFIEVDTFPPFDEIEHGQLFALSLSNNTTSVTHGLHRFPAKFIPQIPAWALDNFAEAQATVMDPFMGSGTTLVEGLLRGTKTIGIDIDPLARFIATAKTANIGEERIRKLGMVLADRWKEPVKNLSVPMAGVQNFDHWFTPSQWGWVQSLQECILELDCDLSERTYMLVIFSSILRLVSNADDQSQKTYVSGTLHKKPPLVQDQFWRFYQRGLAGMACLNQVRHQTSTAIIPANGDALALSVEDETVDLAVTSPPYLDSVDYMYNMMMEYFWLGPILGVPDRKTFNRMRQEHVGAKNPTSNLCLPENLRELINLENMPLARRKATTGYFAMMQRHFHEVARCLKTGSRYVFVIGNSQSLTDIFPLHEALVRQASEAGLRLERAFGYRIRRHYMKFPRAGRGGIILIDWVLIFQKAQTIGTTTPLPTPWVTLDPRAVAH